uniref:Uncharacterized protein n=1 Tax=Gracilinema caldarium TaxID=215591 RepID=A0A7C3E8H5_9SPIR
MKKVATKWFVIVGTVSVGIAVLSCLVILYRDGEEKWALNHKNKENQKELVSYKGEKAITPEWGSANSLALDQLAEEERSRGFSPGMGLAESSLYEKSGDLAGAVFSAFKELFFAYQYGYIKSSVLEERLKAVEKNVPNNPSVGHALTACRALISGNGSRGLDALAKINLDYYELDSFPRWIERVFLLASDRGNEKILDEFLATRSRYNNYPFYWLLIARRSRGNAQLDAAERCVSLAPEGPYAEEGRILMALGVGLARKDAPALRTRMEIEALITAAAQTGNSESLKDLLPLLALPDNPYTLYALGACRGVASDTAFGAFFERETKKASGRLAERLRYVQGGRS